MTLSLIIRQLANRRSWNAIAVLTMMVAVCLIPSVAGQDALGEKANAGKNCGGLHAGIRARLIGREPPATHPAFVMLSFVLLNDSDTPLNSTDQGWKIVIDGKDLSDSDWIFGNGPAPGGGWGTLTPGESYEFGKELEISKYFPGEREYKVCWKGKAFQSSTITVKISDAR